MARYIDAEKMREDWLENGENEFVYDTNAVLDSIDAQPTADVVEVKHGEWKLMGTEKFMDGSCASKFFCSKCLREVGVCHDHESDKYEFAKTMYPYCHCGAKMDVSKMERATERGAK